MVKKRSRSTERKKKQRQRSRWSLIKRAEIRRKNALLKRTLRMSKKSPNERKARQKCMKRTSAISEYERIRMRNIQERLDAMLKSELWSEKEIEDLRKRYYFNP